MTVALRRASSLAVALAIGGAASPAAATEGQTDVGGALFASFLLARGKGTHVGGAGAVFVRHGATDAFDLTAEVSFAAHPTIGSLRLGAAAGVTYVVDIARFRPHFGLLLGVEDLWTVACDPRPSNLAEVDTPRPPLFACGHELMPAAIVPVGLEYAPEAPFRVGLAGRLGITPLRAEVPDTLIAVGLGASFAWIFDDAP